MNETSTDRLKLAARFVNHTAAPIFLTGKAGTGKTTFLRKLAEETYKDYVVLAPTGIAALHAKGVTIHSQFLFPFGTFLPVREPVGNFTDQYGFYTQHTLSGRHSLNQARKNVLRAVELIVIDEVSMLRADVLDAIDFRMKQVKGNYQEPFGGVQLLLIGDLYQLPPIVKDEEWRLLSRFYNSMHFFEAKALQQSGLVYLELDKIFRQQDETFIRVLNHLRDNQVSREDLQVLNDHFKPADAIKEISDCITITTHNYKADEINQRELKGLKSPAYFFDAEREGDFPDALCPLPDRLELKEGARVMFIKNDSSGTSQYFNGKLARVTSLDDSEIHVRMDGDTHDFSLRKEVWENKKYIVNPETKELDEEVIGTFSQFPVKLAWAVTVHKSQGLTFDKAIIDVGGAFAPGQVYVALSRLRSLDGLILRSRIGSDLIYSDQQVVSFSRASNKQEKLTQVLEAHQTRYLQKLLLDTFELESLVRELRYFQSNQESSLEFEDKEMQAAIPSIDEQLGAELKIADRFQGQLIHLAKEQNTELLTERLEKGSAYYVQFLTEILKTIIGQLAMVAHFSRMKKYQEGLESLEQIVFRKLLKIKRLKMIISMIYSGVEFPKSGGAAHELQILREGIVEKSKQAAKDRITAIKNKTGRRKSGVPSPKRKKGDSVAITLELFESGKGIPEIGLERGLAESTIKGHLSVGIEEGRIELENCLPSEVILEIMGSMEKYSGIKELRDHFKGKYDYGTLKMVFAGSKQQD